MLFLREYESDDSNDDGWVVVLLPFQDLVDWEEQLTVTLQVLLELRQLHGVALKQKHL